MLDYGITKKYLIGTKAVNSLIMQVTKLISYGFFAVFTIKMGAY